MNKNTDAFASKPTLQERAEKVASLFPETARRPIVIEFAGTPKAGKTTAINQISSFLKRCGFKVEVVVERAGICPIKDKKHVNFNIWTACTTLSQLLEKTQTPPRPEDPQILILDRGIFDSICWLRLMEDLQRLRPEERKIVESFLTISDWSDRVTGVILMTAKSSDAMEREQGLLPLVGGGGSIMNTTVLDKMCTIAKRTARDMEKLFRVFEVSTSKGGRYGTAKKAVEKVAELVLSLVEQELQEDILHIRKELVAKTFSGQSVVQRDSAKEIEDACESTGSYSPRKAVEKDLEIVQPIPIAVVRNSSGKILRLRRRERSSASPLHEKLVIWAGGHVRKEDARDGCALLSCLTRELEEELRLRISPRDLQLLGAIYVDEGASTSKHVAVVYQWQAPSDNVEVALSGAEFFERRGTSLSGKFVDLKDLLDEISVGSSVESWTSYIIREFLAPSDGHIQDTLF